jgi:hypothetical protein
MDRRISRLRNFLLTGNFPYTVFTFNSPKHQSYIYYYYVYLCVCTVYPRPNTVSIFYRPSRLSTASFPINRNFAVYRTHPNVRLIYNTNNSPYLQDRQSFRYITQLRFFYFAHFLPEFIYYSSPQLIFKAQPNSFGTIRYMQPVSALRPSFFSSSS